MANILTDLQLAMRARILEEPYFATPPAPVLVTEDMGSLNNEIDLAVGKLGVCVVILTVFGEVRQNNQFELVVKCGVFENVDTNRQAGGTQKPASDIALKLMALFLDWRPPSHIWKRFTKPVLRLVDTEPELNYEVAWETGAILEVTP